MDVDATIDFLKAIEKFKSCERTCHTTREDRAESDAEHTWHLAVFLMLLENELEHVDFAKLLKMALIHDLPELYAGDTNPYRDDTVDKEKNERRAAERLFARLPKDGAHDLQSLFDEYVNQETTESKIVKSADKLMPLIQNLCTNARYSSYRKLGVTYEEVVTYMDPFFNGGVLERFYRRLLSEAHDRGVFFDGEPSVRSGT